MSLRDRIERYFADASGSIDRASALQAFNELKFFLNNGEIRAAQRGAGATGWIVNDWVKKGILLGFRLGSLTQIAAEPFTFIDKSTYPLKKVSHERNIRIVPGGTSIRDGCYMANDVVVMPPTYINVGAYVDEGSMLDSHSLVGSCAQVGKRVHLSAGSQLGGVLEPVGAFPVVLEDEVFVGGNCGIFEGTIVKRRAVIAAGVELTGSTRVYDIPRATVVARKNNEPLIIPEGAVVVPGSRAAEGPFSTAHRLSLYTPVIVKYRDERTDAATSLEEGLR